MLSLEWIGLMFCDCKYVFRVFLGLFWVDCVLLLLLKLIFIEVFVLLFWGMYKFFFGVMGVLCVMLVMV